MPDAYIERLNSQFDQAAQLARETNPSDLETLAEIFAQAGLEMIFIKPGDIYDANVSPGTYDTYQVRVHHGEEGGPGGSKQIAKGLEEGLVTEMAIAWLMNRNQQAS